MKNLFIVTLENNDHVQPIVSALSEKDLHGTIIPSTNMIRTLFNKDDVEPVPIFGSIRKLVNAEYHNNTTMLIVLNDNELEIAKQIVRDVTNHFEGNCGKMCALPLSFSEGHIE